MTTDPITLAREVLDLNADAVSGGVIVDDVDVRETLIAAQSLARTVLRMEALAEKHEATARNMGPDSYGGALAAKIAQEIRTALNGDDA